ncbi:DUF6602 domain-containing protein [Flavobacterium sp. SORGH_AS_0622]|uniref:DUF6602 domain-containing protein n=1 Tax=Flavobacterium sp. SORGH_AS_0622 TaxID=3041772 RepID=UPI0027857DC1|nr:DUF6602 domain-containing protein [Flavobacterium sp. SORGH_AS_0622]MDQ1166887.1 hypothetical protein [Flavobacterium sp. SORGH_AS_0622]
MSNANLKELFGGLQNQMIAQLNTNREFITHPGSVGDALENVWIEWLRKYLPNRYCVDKAIVIDSNGATSDQIDVVIYDQHFTPFVFNQNGFIYIPAEGVYAVFEVKPDFQGSVKVSNKETINYFEYAGRKIESVRKLKRTSARIINAGEYKDPRALTKIIGGILTSTNSIKQEKTLINHLKSLTGLKSMEMGCSISYGSFYVDYEGIQDLSPENVQESIEKYYLVRKFQNVEFSEKEISLVSFFLQLTHYLQQVIGTVASIDLDSYANAIGFKIDKRI